MCLSEQSVDVYKLDEMGENSVSNFILLCRVCRRDVERDKEEFFAKPRKHGKYRALYRKAHKRT